jgi:hypothetical protein
MSYSTGTRDTEAYLNTRRRALEAQLKEDARVVAARTIDRFWEKHQWPAEDRLEVLAALGLVNE